MEKQVILTGVFTNDDAAKAAINSLEKNGKSRNDIAALSADRSSGLAFRIHEKTKAAEGGAGGALLGAIVGGIIAALVNFTNSAPTGAEVLAFIDPLIAIFSGVGMGAVLGGLVGAIIGRGMPEHEARPSRGNVKHGNILIAVASDREQSEELLHILKATGGKHLTSADIKFQKEAGAANTEDEPERKQPLTTH